MLPNRNPPRHSAPLRTAATFHSPASSSTTPPQRLVYCTKGPAAAAACAIPPTPADVARLEATTLEGLLAEFRAKAAFSRGSSAFRGVSWAKEKYKWRMQIHNPAIGRQEQSYHDSEVEAARAYDARARVLRGA